VSSTSTRILVALLATFTLLAASATSARAEKKKVVLLKFKGSKAKAIRKGVLKVLKKKFKMVGQAKFVRMQKKLRAKKINERNVAKVAQRLEVHGVVFGKISRKRGRYKLKLTLRAAEDGAVVEEVTINLGKRARLTKQKLREDADSDVEKDSDDDDDGTPLSKDELFDALARDRAVDLAAGLSVIGRNLSFDVSSGIADEPNGYKGTIVPGAFVQGEVYPLAWNKKKKKGALAGIGASFVVDKVLKITSSLEGGSVEIPTTQLRWGVGLRYRINLGDKPTGATIKFGVGYNKLAFELDQQMIVDEGLDIDLPNVAYTYIDPGVAARVPISREMALYADGRFLLVTDTGDIASSDAYGAATASGLDFDGGLEYRMGARLLMRVGARYQRIALSFDGTGALSDRNGDSTSDVSAATDQYFGGYAVAGYLF